MKKIPARDNGANFAWFSRNATRVHAELFDHAGDRTPSRQIDLDPAVNRTGDVWHVRIDGIRHGQFSAYRVDGLWSDHGTGEGIRLAESSQRGRWRPVASLNNRNSSVVALVRQPRGPYFTALPVMPVDWSRQSAEPRTHR